MPIDFRLENYQFVNITLHLYIRREKETFGENWDLTMIIYIASQMTALTARSWILGQKYKKLA